VEPRPHIISRRTHTPQASIVMAHEEGDEGMYEDERTFKKAFFEMSEIVKVLYEERNSRLYGKSSKPPKGDGGKGDEPPKGNQWNGGKPRPSHPSSSSYSTSSTLSQTPPNSPKGHGKTPLLKLDIKFELPMYNGEVNAKKLDNWVH